jgi:hypothetical protein
LRLGHSTVKRRTHQLANRPDMICHATKLHGRGDAQRLMDATKIVMGHIEPNCRLMVFKFFAERVGQSREPALLHPQAQITGWSGPLHSRPKWWGKLVIELIYDTLDPDVAEWLKTHKPLPNARWFQQLSENYGVRKLASRCYEVIGMAKECMNMRELPDKVAMHYGREPVQLRLYLPKIR